MLRILRFFKLNLILQVHSPQYEFVTGGGNYIPETQFKCITLFIITCSLIVGLLAPNIEVVLGLLGSTIGVVICVLCPPFMFLWISTKATTEKVLAQVRKSSLNWLLMFDYSYWKPRTFTDVMRSRNLHYDHGHVCEFISQRNYAQCRSTVVGKSWFKCRESSNSTTIESCHTTNTRAE